MNSWMVIYLIPRMVLRLVFGKARRDRFMQRKYGTRYGSGVWGYAKLLFGFLPEVVRTKLARKLDEGRSRGWSTYESIVQQFIQRKAGTLFVDVGANHGIHCLNAKETFTRIIAFEPHPGNYEKLHANLQDVQNIRIYPLAVSNFEGEAPLYLGFYDGTHCLREKPVQEIYMGTKQVHVTTLAKMLHQEPTINLIKVDVEGEEFRVLEGAKAIMPQIRAWIVELHEESRQDELDRFLQQLGYTTRWLDDVHVYAMRNGEVS